jgi:anti-sigma factor RsiW
VISPATELSCRQLVELVTDYLEDALDPRDRARLDEHIAGCAGCDAYVDQMRATIALLRSLNELGSDAH